MPLGRISTVQVSTSLMNNVQSQNMQQQDLFERVSSNKKMLRISDDPLGTARAMNVRNELNKLDEYSSIVTSASTITNVGIDAIDDAVSTYRRISELAISAADASKNAQDKEVIAIELEQLLDRLVHIGNQTYRGKYIFAGSHSDTPAFEAETDATTGNITGVFYKGDAHTRSVHTRESGTVQISLAGSSAGEPNAQGVFIDSGNNVDAFKSVINMRDRLLANDNTGISGPGGYLEEIENALSSLTSAQVRIGSSQEALELDRKRIIEQNAEYEQDLAQVETADVAQLILELNNVQNVYEAALSVGGRIMKSGLLNFI